MTDIATTMPAGAGRVTARRSPYRTVAAALSRLLRSYNDHLRADSFIVPTGQMASAAHSS